MAPTINSHVTKTPKIYNLCVHVNYTQALNSIEYITIICTL